MLDLISPLLSGEGMGVRRGLVLVLFVRYMYVCSNCACLVLSVSSSTWCLGGAAFVIVALSGLFSYLFFQLVHSTCHYIIEDSKRHS